MNLLIIRYKVNSHMLTFNIIFFNVKEEEEEEEL